MRIRRIIINEDRHSEYSLMTHSVKSHILDVNGINFHIPTNGNFSQITRNQL